MNKEQYLQHFFSSFGVPAYDEGTVPDDARLPYITYSVTVDNYDAICALNASIWDRGESWTKVTDLSHAIAEKLNNTSSEPIDGGYIYLSRGTPFSQRISDADKQIRRIALNINAQYLTET